VADQKPHVWDPWDPELPLQEQVDWCIRCADGTTWEGPWTFITTFCKTVDDMGQVNTIPRWEFVQDTVKDLWEGGDLHIEKSRQMMATWIVCAYMLWELQFRPQFIGFMTSRKEKLVDDGGENSSPNSLFGRIRWMHSKLPMYVKREVAFSFLKASCPANGAYIIGESANINMGRGGTYARLVGDEWAWVPQSELCFAAIRSACPRGIVLPSTPKGPTGNFSRLKKEKPPGFKFLRLHWTRHPERAKDAYVDPETGKLRSPWYDKNTQSMTPDQVARELDISYAKSIGGLVYTQFNEDRHVTAKAKFQPGQTVTVGLDFGIGAATAAVIGHIAGRELHVFADYEMVGKTGYENACNLKEKILAMGYRGRLDERGRMLDVTIYADPAGNAKEIATGSTVVREFRKVFPYVYTRKSRILDGIRAVRRLFIEDRLYIHPRCETFINWLAEYKFPTNLESEVLQDVPEKGPASHIMDALRYLVINNFPADDGVDVTTGPVARTLLGDGPLLSETPDKKWNDAYDHGPMTTVHRREF